MATEYSNTPLVSKAEQKRIKTIQNEKAPNTLKTERAASAEGFSVFVAFGAFSSFVAFVVVVGGPAS